MATFIVGANPQPFELGALSERGELGNSSRKRVGGKTMKMPSAGKGVAGVS